MENTEENRRRYRELLITTPNLGEHIGGAILFEETLYQSTANGTPFVDALRKQGLYPGIKAGAYTRPFSAQPEPFWSVSRFVSSLRRVKSLPVDLVTRNRNHPTFPTKSAYVELRSGRVEAPA